MEIKKREKDRKRREGDQEQMRSRKRERGKTWKKHFSNKSLDKQR